jgi:cell division GTPase FtsZ
MKWLVRRSGYFSYDKTELISSTFRFLDWLMLTLLPGLVNVDFSDVHTIMQNAGSSLMSIGTDTGR